MLGKNFKNVHTLQGCSDLSRDSEIYGRAFAEMAKRGKYHERPPREDATLNGMCIEWGLSLTDDMGKRIHIVNVGKKRIDHYTCLPNCFRRVRLSATPWTAAHQAPLSMGFSRREYWSGLPFPSPGDLPALGIEPRSLMSLTLAGGFSTPPATREALTPYSLVYKQNICVYVCVCVWIHEIIVAVAQSCLTLCDPMNRSTPGLRLSPAPGVHPNSRPLSQWWNPTISSSVTFFSFCFQSSPASGSFPMCVCLCVYNFCIHLPKSEPVQSIFFPRSLVAHTVKNLSAMQETPVWSLGWEDTLEEGMATHSSILAWRIPWTDEPGGLQSTGLQSHTQLSD